jgi:hypothetical protein
MNNSKAFHIVFYMVSDLLFGGHGGGGVGGNANMQYNGDGQGIIPAAGSKRMTRCLDYD